MESLQLAMKIYRHTSFCYASLSLHLTDAEVLQMEGLWQPRLLVPFSHSVAHCVSVSQRADPWQVFHYYCICCDEM